jgi:hypothetical protein
LDKEYSTCTSSFTPSSTSLMIQTSHASSGWPGHMRSVH